MVFDPLVLIERLAALVPRPLKHLTTYRGVFAPNASYRDRIVSPPFRTCQHPRRNTDGRIDVLVCPDCGVRHRLLTLPWQCWLLPPAEAAEPVDSATCFARS